MNNSAAVNYRDTSFSPMPRTRGWGTDPHRAPAQPNTATIAEHTTVLPPAPPPPEQPKQQEEAVVKPGKILLEKKNYVATCFVQEGGKQVQKFAEWNGDWTTDIRKAQLFSSQQMCARQGACVADVTISIRAGISGPTAESTTTDYVARAYPKNGLGTTMGKKTGDDRYDNHHELEALMRFVVVQNGREAIKFTETLYPQDAFSYSKEAVTARCKTGDDNIARPLNHSKTGVEHYELVEATRTFAIGSVYPPVPQVK